MRLLILIILIAVASVVRSAPVVPGLIGGNEDVLVQEQLSGLIDLFLRVLLAGEVPRQRPEPTNLLQLASRFLGGGESAVRDEVVQDPRVLNFEQEINRRNQLSRLARVFTSILLR